MADKANKGDSAFRIIHQVHKLNKPANLWPTADIVYPLILSAEI